MIITIDTTAKIDAIKKRNQDLAVKALEKFFDNFRTIEIKKMLDIEVDEVPIKLLKDYAKVLIEQSKNPCADITYQPPLPPGVPPPPVASISATITRQPGWNSVLGYKIELIISDQNYVPANIALAVYNLPNCNGYKFTTGAFQYNETTNTYYSVCPAGFEPGNVDVHMGLLYGSAKLSCFTLPAGTNETEKLVYNQQ